MDILKELKERFSSVINSVQAHSSRRIYLGIDPARVGDVAGHLFGEAGFRFITASGVDLKDSVEVLYHFSDDTSGGVLTLRVSLDPVNPEVESLKEVIPRAEPAEQEIYELMGVSFRGNDTPGNLILGRGYRGRKFPLRKK